jgi:hypothetical protein
MRSKLLPALLGCVFLSACGKQETINEVQFGITSAAAVARTAAIAMEAIKGSSMVCASVRTGCSTYSCNGAVTVNLGAACPLPLGGEASGTVEVTGSWSSADDATLSQSYTNARVAAFDKALAVANVTQLRASRSGDTITVKYTAANATAGASGSAVAIGGSATWDVEIDTKGTPDPADDKVTVDVSSSSAGAGFGAQARVVKVNSAVIDPSCRSNPISGTADITEVSGFIPQITKIQFHAACDAQAEVDGKTTDFLLFP